MSIHSYLRLHFILYTIIHFYSHLLFALNLSAFLCIDTLLFISGLFELKEDSKEVYAARTSWLTRLDLLYVRMWFHWRVTSTYIVNNPYKLLESIFICLRTKYSTSEYAEHKHYTYYYSIMDRAFKMVVMGRVCTWYLHMNLLRIAFILYIHEHL